VSTPDPDLGKNSSIVGRLAEEMSACWRVGRRPAAEEFLDRLPWLWDRTEAALELIAEELALREEHGQPVSDSELIGRFPQWPVQMLALRECQRAFGCSTGAVRFPPPGDTVGGFRLITELGRGAHGRVFLAAQSSLGDRPVVLKLTPADGGEHLSLARLQHTHIVPLYSTHEFPEYGLRGLCMPYFGGATLAAMLSAAGPVVGFPGGAARPAVACRIGACLGDALHYAHERGLLHLDLKPSNVLFAGDGTPMLLDFHLARPPLKARDPAPLWLGGTAGYMAPELVEAVRAVQDGEPVPDDIDARADVFSLGVLLREVLAGVRLPVGLSDILARCTAPRRLDRYPTAADLAADLRRHLADQPLLGVANRSPVERWRKWRRRRPYALPFVLLVASATAAGVTLVLHATALTSRATKALCEGETSLHQGRYTEAAEAFLGGEAVIAGVPFEQSLSRRLRDARLLAERGQAASELHALCERVRPLYAAAATPEQVRGAEARCRDVWAERETIVGRLAGQPTPALERQWRADLLDVGILCAHLQPRAARPDRAGEAHRRALTILDEAESLLRPSGVLHQERAVHARALGLTRLADESTRRAGAVGPRTPWERLIAGRAYLGAGELDRALAELNGCLQHDPGSLWANYYRGVCLLRIGEPADAAEAFSVCVALSSGSAWCLYNRGLAYSQAGRPDRARADFDRALALDPSLPIPVR
jgi:tetratricopeptide (TPR) repeat protein